MKTGKSLTFRSILISYLVLCLVMLTVTIIGYSSSIFYVQKEIRNSAALRMKEVVGKIENNIRLSYQLCDTLAVSGGLDDLAAIEGNFSPQQILDSMKLKNTMSELNVQNNLCQNLHIYFLKSDSILSSNTQRREGKEDIGFFCIDNVPAGLLPSITAFSEAGDSQLERVALSMDVRGCRTSEEIEQALHKLDEQGILYKVLFLDAPDDVLMRRYSETRRRHPISISEGISTREAFAKERKILKPLQERADYTINTALLSTAQNKERICDLFVKNGGAKSAMRLTVMSFGFKFGIPPEADLVLDVRCLPNPFYVPELKHKTGLDQEVVDFVMAHPEAQELLKRYESFLQYALPLYVKEGKSQLTIAVGCTGGKHRSITFARKIAEYCTALGYEPGVQHRDAMR